MRCIQIIYYKLELKLSINNRINGKYSFKLTSVLFFRQTTVHGLTCVCIDENINHAWFPYRQLIIDSFSSFPLTTLFVILKNTTKNTTHTMHIKCTHFFFDFYRFIKYLH